MTDNELYGMIAAMVFLYFVQRVIWADVSLPKGNKLEITWTQESDLDDESYGTKTRHLLIEFPECCTEDVASQLKDFLKEVNGGQQETGAEEKEA